MPAIFAMRTYFGKLVRMDAALSKLRKLSKKSNNATDVCDWDLKFQRFPIYGTHIEFSNLPVAGCGHSLEMFYFDGFHTGYLLSSYSNGSSCGASGQALARYPVAGFEDVIGDDPILRYASRGYAVRVVRKASPGASWLFGVRSKCCGRLCMRTGASRKEKGKNRNAALECFTARGFHMDNLLGSSNVMLTGAPKARPVQLKLGT